MPGRLPRSRPEELEIIVDDLGALTARMRALDERGRGWVNLQPAVDPDDVPPPTGVLAGLFSARGPQVPLCTWVAGERTEIGIQHAAGPKAAETLRAQGIDLPQGWRVAQDSPRRGLVVVLPADATPERALGWLLRAGAALSAVPFGDTWRAMVYEGA